MAEQSDITPAQLAQFGQLVQEDTFKFDNDTGFIIPAQSAA
jgi:hypothetical protein